MLTRIRVNVFFFSSRRRHTRFDCDWSSDVCSSDLDLASIPSGPRGLHRRQVGGRSRDPAPCRPRNVTCDRTVQEELVWHPTIKVGRAKTVLLSAVRSRPVSVGRGPPGSTVERLPRKHVLLSDIRELDEEWASGEQRPT